MKQKEKKVKRIAIVLMLCIIANTTLVYASGYSPYKAATYAQKYAITYNSEYPEFSSDCTNYVSQCVKAGNISVESIPSWMVGYSSINDVYRTKSYWDCKKYTDSLYFYGAKLKSKTGFVWTSTWSVAEHKSLYWGFYDYMKDRGATCMSYKVDTKASLDEFLKNCQKGDILQVSYSDGVKDHSVIVTEKTYNFGTQEYNIKICYHTNDTLSLDFRTEGWRKFGHDATWTIVRVADI